MAKFAFWNVQRIGNVETNSQIGAFRAGYFQAVVKDIIISYAPSFFVMAEVTSAGGAIKTWLDGEDWFKEKYEGKFEAVNHSKNPCNFFIVKKKKDTVFYHGPYGTNLQRPFLMLSASSGLKVAFAHLKSGGSVKTEDELETIVTDMASGKVDAICGDLNLNYAKVFSGATELNKSLHQMGYTALPPAGGDTFGKWNGLARVTKTLDFLVCKQRLASKVVATSMAYHHDFDVIDHKPILFQIKK